MREMMELAHKDFETAIINMFNNLNDNVNLMKRKQKI